MHDILYALLRTTLMLTLCGGVCFVALRKIETRLPRLSRFLWIMVLLTGWIWLQPAIHIPWKEQPKSEPTPIQTIMVEHVAPPMVMEPPRFVEPPVWENTPEPTVVETVPETKTFEWKPLILPAVFAVWLGGMVLSILLAAIGYIRVLLLLRKTEPAGDALAEPWKVLLTEHGIDPRTIPMLVSRNLGPALIRTPLGYRLTVPDELWSELSESGRLAVLQHELAHFRRRDVWKSFFVRILALPHWFNPVAHYAANRFDELAEQLCDREAFSGKREGISEFARTLLLMHENAPTHFVARQSIFGRDLKRRVASLLEDTPLQRVSAMKKTLLLLGTAAILCAALFRVEFVEKIVAKTPVDDTSEIHYMDKRVEYFPKETVELRLLVVDEEKNPVPETQLKIQYEGDTAGSEFVWKTDSNGRINAKIPLAVVQPTTQLYLSNRDKGLLAWESFWSIPSGWTPNDPIDLTFTVFKARRLTGTVVDQDGKPVADALVGYSIAPSFFHTKTDKEGKFELDAMRFSPLMLYAIHPIFGAAVAYPDFPPEEAWRGEGGVGDDAWQKMERNNGPFTIKLERGEPISVKVTDTEGNPIEGAVVSPSYFSTDKSFWNTWFLKEIMPGVTDQNGTAMFTWIPTSRYKIITFDGSGTNPRFEKESPARFYGKGDAVWRAEKKNNHLVIQLPKKILVEGSVRCEDGSVPQPMQMYLQGKKYDSCGIETDYKGDFSFFANVDEIVSIHPIYNQYRNEKPLVAQAKLRVDVGNGKKPVPRFDFVMKPGTKVFGKLPKTNSHLQIFEMSGPDDKIDNQNERLGRDTKDGVYEALLPPGTYRFKIDGKESDIALGIKGGEKEIQLNFNAEGRGSLLKPLNSPSPKTDATGKPDEKVTGRVVDEDGKPLEEVRVLIGYPHYLEEGKKNETKTDADGRFVFSGPYYIVKKYENGKTTETNRSTLFFSKPGHEQQVRMLGSPADDLNVVLRRGVQVQGRVIDDRTGKPAADVEVKFSDINDRTAVARNEQTARTDRNGNFTTASFLPAGRYVIVGEKKNNDGQAWGKYETVDVSLKNPVFHAPDLHIDLCGWAEGRFRDSKTGGLHTRASANIHFVTDVDGKKHLYSAPWNQQILMTVFKFPLFPGENRLLISNSKPDGNLDGEKILNVKPGEAVKLDFVVETPPINVRIIDVPAGRATVFRKVPLSEEEHKILTESNLALEDLFRFENGNWVDVKTGEKVQGDVHIKEGLKVLVLNQTNGKIIVTDENGKTDSYDVVTLGTVVKGVPKLMTGTSNPVENPQPVGWTEVSARPSVKKTYDEVNGRVVDENGKPIEGVFINVEYPESKDADKKTETKTNADGRYSLKGPFHLETFMENGKPVGWLSPSLVFHAEGKACQKIRILDKSNELNAVLQPGVRLQGRVIDERTGRGAANTIVRFCDMNALDNLLQLNRDTKTDAEGNYQTPFDLRPGRYVVFVLDENDPKNETLGKIEPVEVRLGIPVFQVPDLHVNQCGWIAGSFVDAETGEPVTMNGVNIDHVCTSPNKFRKVFDQQPFLMTSGTTFKARAFPGANMLRLVGDRDKDQIKGLDRYCTKLMNVKPDETVSLKFEVVRKVTVEALGKLPEAVEEEREAAEAVKRLGGWYKIDADKHIVEVNMVCRDTDGVRYDNPQKETDAVMAILGKFSRLKTLLICNGQATDESAKHFAELPNLETLYFWDANKISDVGAAYLGTLKKLRMIHMNWSYITDETLKIFAGLPEIRELSLQQNAITNRGLEYLREAKNLEKLWWCLGKTKPNDESLKILGEFPNLREVEIQSAEVTAAGFDNLARSPSLKKVSFEWPDGDKRPNNPRLAESLAKLKTLEVFSSMSVDFSEDEARTLARSLPKLKELGKWNAEQLERLRK